MNFTVDATDPNYAESALTIHCTWGIVGKTFPAGSTSEVFSVGTRTVSCHAYDPTGNTSSTASFTIKLSTVPRAMLVAAALTIAATSAATLHPESSQAAASPGWSGSASCTITVTGPGYQHSETQRWQIAGPTTVRGSFHFVPSRWTDTGSGSSHEAQADQTRDITWTVKAAAAGQFQFVVRASDGRLLIGQANAQLRVANGITGTQQQTIGGVAQTPSRVGLEALETQLPPIVVGATTRSVSGSTPPTRVSGSSGPFQPAGARVTKSCTWRFARAGTR